MVRKRHWVYLIPGQNLIRPDYLPSDKMIFCHVEELLCDEMVCLFFQRVRGVVARIQSGNIIQDNKDRQGITRPNLVEKISPRTGSRANPNRCIFPRFRK